MKKLVPITIVCILAAVSVPQQATAQTQGEKARSGSIYSNFGVGVPVDLSSSSAVGMGAVGVSFYEPNIAGLANPATWGSTYRTVASGGFSLQKFDAVDYSGSSSNAVFATNNFQLQLPLRKNRFGISVALAPLTRSNYRLLETETQIIGSGSQLDTLSVNVQNEGDGGINSMELGFGWRISDHISVGYAASLVFASIKNNVASGFLNPNYQPVSYTLQTSGTGLGNRFGTQITFPRVFSEQDHLRLGAAVSLPVSLNAKRIQQSDKEVGTNSIESVSVSDGNGLGDGTINLPLRASGGLTYQLTPGLSVTTEGLYQQWSDFEFSFRPGQQELLSDRYKGAVGVRYFPFVSGSNRFLSRFKYRAGVSYDTGHLKIAGKQIETLLFSAGIGIPSPKSYSSIDISFHYGFRGTKAQNLVKESIWGLQLSINLAELMFVRPKLQ